MKPQKNNKPFSKGGGRYHSIFYGMIWEFQNSAPLFSRAGDFQILFLFLSSCHISFSAPWWRRRRNP
jgi:hypothetical protein